MAPTEVDVPTDLRLYTTSDTGRFLKKPAACVARLIRDGLLKAVLVGTEYRIKHEDLIAFLEANRATGPMACRDPRRNGRRPTGRPPRIRRDRPAKRAVKA